jgi:1-acyl-sn-glycerol-3-phosphate acyltransferase
VSDVGDTNGEDPEIGQFDPGLTQRLMGVLRPVLKRYFRSEVHGLESFPPGGALVVGNHSGGMFPMDVPIFSIDFYEKFGYNRPVYTLSHDILFMGVTGGLFRRTGYIRANRENAAKALRSGGVVVVFPGGDYDAYRPTLAENVIDFNGRKGYVSTAIEAGVPIVPAVSIGGQETQLYLTRGTWLAERLGIKRLLRSAILPVSFGFPFGLSAVVPPNVPLPTKIITQVLEPIDITAKFGEDPDIDEVDAHVRHVMQRALDQLAEERRLPVLG